MQIKQREEAMSTGGSTKDLLQPGNSVNILEGPFNGLKAVLSRTDGQQRAIVLISLLNQQIPVSFTNTQIKKVDYFFWKYKQRRFLCYYLVMPSTVECSKLIASGH